MLTYLVKNLKLTQFVIQNRMNSKNVHAGLDIYPSIVDPVVDNTTKRGSLSFHPINLCVQGDHVADGQYAILEEKSFFISFLLITFSLLTIFVHSLDYLVIVSSLKDKYLSTSILKSRHTWQCCDFQNHAQYSRMFLIFCSFLCI